MFRLYCQTPFGRLHHRNPDFVALADRLGRTTNSVVMKACNFASLDPFQQARNIAGLKNSSNADKQLWVEFKADSEAVANEAETAWESLQSVALQTELPIPRFSPESTEAEVTIKARRVQRFFRNAVLSAYDWQCAITGIRVSSLLNASHIIPWSANANRRADTTNGLCLNALHDRAFDRGLITFDEDFRVVVSKSLKDEVDQPWLRKMILDFEGSELAMPAQFRPDVGAISYHQFEVFLG